MLPNKHLITLLKYHIASLYNPTGHVTYENSNLSVMIKMIFFFFFESYTLYSYYYAGTYMVKEIM